MTVYFPFFGITSFWDAAACPGPLAAF